MRNSWKNSSSEHLSSIVHSRWIMLSVLILLSVAACSPRRQPMLSQPVSPPLQISESPLMGGWVLTSVTMQGQAESFDLFKPIRLVFGDGLLVISSERCGFGRYAIVFSDTNAYRFGESMYTAQDCGREILQTNPAIDCSVLAGSNADAEQCAQAVAEQLNVVSRALEATNTFDTDGDVLILSGDQVELRLVRDQS